MKKTKWIPLLAVLFAVTLSGCNSRADAQTDAPSASGQETAQQETAQQETTTQEEPGYSQSREGSGTAGGRHHVKINIKEYGTISVELYTEDAPITVENFIKLAKEGFYDGLTFHRVIEGFMMQGGDPEGTGLGGAKETIKGEFKSNDVDNALSHTRGAISMARSQKKDSASSQFFIVHKDSTHLDGDYAAFGYVTEGMEIVDKICESTPVTDSNGTVEKGNQPVIESIEVID